MSPRDYQPMNNTEARLWAAALNDPSPDNLHALLSAEFHTQNGIPTDPRSHSLFFVPRTGAVLAWLGGIAGSALFTYGVSHGSVSFWVVGVVLAVIPAYIAFR